MAGINAVLNSMYLFYDSIFQPLLVLGPYASLAFFSAVLAGIFSMVHWRLLDVEKADEIKDKLNEHQDKMKEARKGGESEKASDHMSETMKLNQELMKLNMKPMVGTMVFVALIFPWLGATYAPTVDMNKTGNSTFAGELEYAGKTQRLAVDNTTGTSVVQLDGQESREKEVINALGIEWQVANFKDKGGGFFAPDGEGKVLKLNAEFIKLPFSLPFIGGALNWLGFYILIAMPLTYGIRKVLGIA